MNALTGAYAFAVLWLGCPDQSGGRPIGSGVVVNHREQQYMATAHHVLNECRNTNEELLVRRGREWQLTSFQIVGENTELDIAVLQMPVQIGPTDGLKYGLGHSVLGSLGRAVGFPSDAEGGNRIAEMNTLPLPIQVVVAANFNPGEKTHIAGGYDNAGFSGGAVMFQTDSAERDKDKWTIAGIITSRGHVWRKPRNTEDFGEDREIVVMEPTGIIHYTGMNEVLDLIDKTR